MASVPVSGTNIRLLTGVPFSNDYKNSRWFDTPSEQTTYFTNKPIVYQASEHTFQRFNEQTFIRVNRAIDTLLGSNYLMFQNKQYNSKWFYAFVTKLEYVNKSVTNVHFQLDVFQTWKFDFQFKPSFVTREHCKLWNSDGTPVINTIDEGLNYGTEYDTVSFQNYVPYGSLNFLVIVCKSVMHGEATKKITPTLNGMPQPLSYYVHPFRMDGSTPKVFIGSGEYAVSSILDTLKGIYTQDDSVNNVVSLYVTDYLGVDVDYNVETGTLTLNEEIFGSGRIADNENKNVNTIYVKKLPAYGTKRATIESNKYSKYRPVKESKLLMYPYTVLILDDYKGNRHEFKNEYIDGKSLKLNVRGSIGTSNRVAYSIEEYNTEVLDSQASKYSLETGLQNINPNDIPIINDFLAAYLQGNRNSIENQKASINFNGLMSVLGSGVSGVSSGLGGSYSGVAQSGLGAISGAGNTVLQLQGIEAKQKDISNTPPSLSKMGSNTNFDYGNGLQGVFIIKKQIKEEYRKKLSDFFNMFGYKVNEVKIPNFHTRKYWNYVETKNCTITGNFNNEDLNEIKSVFDNGITFWHTDDVGNYSLENEVL